jgi:hypothetical protein
MLVLAIAENLYKLLENCGVTSMATLRKLSRVMEMAVDFAFMFVVRVLSTKDRRTD